MAQISPMLRNCSDGTLMFWCPGCDCPHGPNVVPQEGRPCWGYNDNPNAPTFTPSILVRWNRWNEATQQYNDEYKRCHSFVTDGNIQFLGDCTHSLAGQTVPIPPWPISNWDDGD